MTFSRPFQLICEPWHNGSQDCTRCGWQSLVLLVSTSSQPGTDRRLVWLFYFLRLPRLLFIIIIIIIYYHLAMIILTNESHVMMRIFVEQGITQVDAEPTLWNSTLWSL